jgi:hypothetical protein
MDRGGGRFGFGLNHIKTGDDGAKVRFSWIHAKGVRPRLWHTHPTSERAMNSCAAGSVLEQAQQKWPLNREQFTAICRAKKG